jgi:hypothetical protein
LELNKTTHYCLDSVLKRAGLCHGRHQGTYLVRWPHTNVVYPRPGQPELRTRNEFGSINNSILITSAEAVRDRGWARLQWSWRQQAANGASSWCWPMRGSRSPLGHSCGYFCGCCLSFRSCFDGVSECSLAQPEVVCAKCSSLNVALP